MGLSIRAYARHRGVSHVAVKKAIDTGRITPLPDGTIDPQAADAQWAQNTLQPRKAAAADKAPATKVRVEPATPPPPRETPEVATPPLSTGGTSLLQARTVNEVLKAQLNKVELAHRKRELVDRAQAVAHVFKLARIERVQVDLPASPTPQGQVKIVLLTPAAIRMIQGPLASMFK